MGIFYMKDFEFLDYCTEYSCKGDYTQKMKQCACFGFIFNRVETELVTETYKIILYKGTEYSKENHQSNACLFTHRQIKNHLKQAQEIYPFKFRVTEGYQYGYDFFRVTLTLNKLPGTFHKYLLTWLRYLYEFPYNVILLDAYKLKRVTQFRYTSISDLFNLVLGCYLNDPREIHQIARNVINNRLKKKEIREKLNQVNQLNDIYERLKVKDRVIPRYSDEYAFTDIEYWSDYYFEKDRKPIYLDTYKDIKKK